MRREDLHEHPVLGLTFLSEVPALGPGVTRGLASLIVDQIERAGLGNRVDRIPPIVLVGWNLDVAHSSPKEIEDHDRRRVTGWSSAWE